jgi:hypothetical protein
MVYMDSSQRTLLWGGAGFVQTAGRYAGSRFYGDTWEWDGESWVQVADTGPAPNAGIGLAFDSARNVVVMFAYHGWADPDRPNMETWERDGQGWTQVGDSGPRTYNHIHQIVYDSARQVTLLEGGSIGSDGAKSYEPVGTWVWNGNVWTQVADVGQPLRVSAALAYDASRERAVTFSAQIPAGDSMLNPGTWE